MTALDIVQFHKVSRAIATIEDFPTRKALEEIVRALDQLQDIQFCARSTELDGLSSDNQLAEQINGVYLRFVSKGFQDLVHVRKHGLQRVPQGCIFIRRRTSNNECLIEGDLALGIQAATTTEVSFVIGDPAGSIVVGLLL